MAKLKKPTVSSLKKKLDIIFSKYIRLKDADASGNVECYTCGVVKHVKEMQNGHFQSRKHTSTRFLHTKYITNCKPQCVKCNIYSEGEKWIFGNKLVSEYGQDAVDELIRESNKSVNLSKGDLIELIEHYKESLKNLLE